MVWRACVRLSLSLYFPPPTLFWPTSHLSLTWQLLKFVSKCFAASSHLLDLSRVKSSVERGLGIIVEGALAGKVRKS